MKSTRDIKWKQANILLALCVFNRCNLIKFCKEREGERESELVSDREIDCKESESVFLLE